MNIVKKPSVIETQPDDEQTVAPGEWYWYESQDGRVLVCVMRVGTNYVKIKAIDGRAWRVHFDDFDDFLVRESDALGVLRGYVDAKHVEIRDVMAEINEATRMLAASNTPATASLARLGDSIADHKGMMLATKDELPELFKTLNEHHKALAELMAAEALPLQAQVGDLKDLTDKIDDRLLTIDLYAGLSEDAVQLRKGAPAAYDEPLAVRQRMLYMDEECLPFYQAGGMRFRKIDDFDKWLLKGDRFRTFLPEDRCVVAFRVRREMRDYGGPADSLSAFIAFWHEAKQDMLTFLYVRNGEQVWRVSTAIDFGERLFPNADARLINDQLMIHKGTWGMQVMTRREYDERLAAYLQWRDANPTAHRWDYRKDRNFAETVYVDADGGAHGWAAYSRDSVYFDDATDKIRREMAEFNRVAVVLQGLFDRSTILHPHPPVQTWTGEGFDRAIRLVYDNDHALAPTDLPDFEAYQAQLNASITAGTVTVGQYRAWREHLRDKYDRDVPYELGRSSPGAAARVAKAYPRAQACTFKFTRATNTYDYNAKDWKRTGVSFKCPMSALLNADAYTPGDFRRFYADPRTRRQYLKWAPLMLLAEDYKAGKLIVGESA